MPRPYPTGVWLRLREFSHDIERAQGVVGTAQQSEDGFIYSGIDEVAQSLAAMMRRPRDTERLDCFIGNERGRARDVASRDGSDDRLLIERNSRRLDVGGEKLVAHHESKLF